VGDDQHRFVSLSLISMKNSFKLTVAGALLAVAVAGCGGGNGGLNNGGNNGGNNGAPSTTQNFTQIDRLARPVVNEVLATFAGGRHLFNDTDNPTEDRGQLDADIQNFMTGTAGRSQATTDAVKSVLVPDVMVVDLSVNSTTAAYLGSETGGATGSTFGGRALKDDVVDTSLGVIFGNTISALKLAPDDGKEIPTLTSDNVGAGAKNYSSTFPYLGSPK